MRIDRWKSASNTVQKLDPNRDHESSREVQSISLLKTAKYALNTSREEKKKITNLLDV